MDRKNSDFQKLADHINSYYGGNNSEFGRAYGVERNQVQQWLKAKKPVLVLPDGCLIQVIREPGKS